MKDAEATLLSEADSLANELQEKTNQLTEAKKEMIRVDQASKDEIGRLSHMAGLISAELEKRVNELTQVTAERNALATEQAADRKKIETLEASLTSLEGTFKSTIQGDRERIKVRVRALHSSPTTFPRTPFKTLSFTPPHLALPTSSYSLPYFRRGCASKRRNTAPWKPTNSPSSRRRKRWPPIWPPRNATPPPCRWVYVGSYPGPYLAPI